METLLNLNIGDTIQKFLSEMMFAEVITSGKWIMILVACFFLYLAIHKQYEPLLLLPIAFGMLITNLPGAEMYHTELFEGGHVHWENFSATAGLIDYLYLGVKLGIYPPLIFLAVGAMTDFGPLIANPKSLLLGAAAQLGIFTAFFGALIFGMTPEQAASVGIIGGADGPTAIFVTTPAWTRPAWMAALLIIGVVGYLLLRRCKAKSK